MTNKLINHIIYFISLILIIFTNDSCDKGKTSLLNDSENLNYLINYINDNKKNKYFYISVGYELGYIKTMQINGAYFKEMPTILKSFDHLEMLYLEKIDIDSSIVFPDLKNLKNLEISNSNLVKIPELSNLKALTDLDISLNSKLQDSIILDLPNNIERVDMTLCPIKKLVIRGNSSIKILSLDLTKITEIDNSIYDLPKLEKLYIYNDELSEIDISRFRNIKYIKCNGKLFRNINLDYFRNLSIVIDTNLYLNYN